MHEKELKQLKEKLREDGVRMTTQRIAILEYLLELTYGDDASRYDFNIGKHYHVVCQLCGRVEDLFYPLIEDVESVAEELTGYKVQGHRMEVFGICPNCQDKM